MATWSEKADSIHSEISGFTGLLLSFGVPRDTAERLTDNFSDLVRSVIFMRKANLPEALCIHVVTTVTKDVYNLKDD